MEKMDKKTLNFKILKSGWGIEFTKTLATDLNKVFDGYEIALLHVPKDKGYLETLPK